MSNTCLFLSLNHSLSQALSKSHYSRDSWVDLSCKLQQHWSCQVLPSSGWDETQNPDFLVFEHFSCLVLSSGFRLASTVALSIRFAHGDTLFSALYLQ